MKHPVPRICSVCGDDEGLEAHHLRPKAVSSEDGIPDSPTIWLCREHHGLVHGVRWSGDLAALSRRAHERRRSALLITAEADQRAMSLALEMGIPRGKIDLQTIAFVQRLDKICGLLRGGKSYIIDIHRESGMVGWMGYNRFRQTLADYVYQPKEHGAWRL